MQLGVCLLEVNAPIRLSKPAALNSYANNQQLYCWLPDNIYGDYRNSGKQAYSPLWNA